MKKFNEWLLENEDKNVQQLTNDFGAYLKTLGKNYGFTQQTIQHLTDELPVGIDSLQQVKSYLLSQLKGFLPETIAQIKLFLDRWPQSAKAMNWQNAGHHVGADQDGNAYLPGHAQNSNQKYHGAWE